MWRKTVMSRWGGGGLVTHSPLTLLLWREMWRGDETERVRGEVVERKKKAREEWTEKEEVIN